MASSDDSECDHSLGNLIHMPDKRCRNLNYYINYVLYYIPLITENTENPTDIVKSFEIFIKAIFSLWGNWSSEKKLKCKLADKEYTIKIDLIKLLDNYCENRNAFRIKLKEYNKITCCKYYNHVNEMKRFLHGYISRRQLKNDHEDFNIDENCTLIIFDKTFPNIICNESTKLQIEIDKLQITDMHGQLNGVQEDTLSVPKPEYAFNNSPAKIALISVSTLLGACLSGLYLSRYLDSLEESNTFNIAYDPMHN
ncbi:unspecified product [Plasmodium ovale curtisi]|uniref:Unspecified product n=1 Tax=Plasmodium ovale curtisi TaxID=864141 RepID=A0A1A8X106_PLAOA|nr:unspecified product [Plasmodium ovale curtisi]